MSLITFFAFINFIFIFLSETFDFDLKKNFFMVQIKFDSFSQCYLFLLSDAAWTFVGHAAVHSNSDKSCNPAVAERP